MNGERDPSQLRPMLEELSAARDEFVAALDQADPALLTAPGLAGEWSARELIAHLGYWAGHAAEALHHAEQGRTADFGEDEMDVDERNALVTALQRADPAWLDERVAYGDSLEQVIRDDGADHYREHAADLRAWFSGGGDEPDE